MEYTAKNATTSADAIYSDLGTDPDFAELLEMYVDEMPDRIAALRDAHAAGDAELLQRTAHQMKGAAGSYGFSQLTSYATALEFAVRDRASEEEVLQTLDELVLMCGKVRAGTSS